MTHEITTRWGTFSGKTFRAAKKLAQKAEESGLLQQARVNADYKSAMLLARARAWQVLVRLAGGNGPSNNWLFLRPGEDHFGTYARDGEFGHVLTVDGADFDTGTGGLVGLALDCTCDAVLGYLMGGYSDGERFYAVAAVNGQKCDASCPGVTADWLDDGKRKRAEERAASEKTDDALVASGQA